MNERFDELRRRIAENDRAIVEGVNSGSGSSPSSGG